MIHRNIGCYYSSETVILQLLFVDENNIVLFTQFLRVYHIITVENLRNIIGGLSIVGRHNESFGLRSLCVVLLIQIVHLNDGL